MGGWLGAARLRLGGSPRWVGEIVSGVPEARRPNPKKNDKVETTGIFRLGQVSYMSSVSK